MLSWKVFARGRTRKKQVFSERQAFCQFMLVCKYSGQLHDHYLTMPSQLKISYLKSALTLTNKVYSLPLLIHAFSSSILVSLNPSLQLSFAWFPCYFSLWFSLLDASSFLFPHSCVFFNRLLLLVTFSTSPYLISLALSVLLSYMFSNTLPTLRTFFSPSSPL